MFVSNEEEEDEKNYKHSMFVSLITLPFFCYGPRCMSSYQRIGMLKVGILLE